MLLKRFLLIFVAIVFLISIFGCEKGLGKTSGYQNKGEITINEPTYNSLQEYKKPKTETGEQDNSAKTEEINGDETQKESEEYTGVYIANKKSKIFHKETCPYISKMKEKNIYKTDNIEQLTGAGYVPCSRCKPN